jgi:hypothetical protein
MIVILGSEFSGSFRGLQKEGHFWDGEFGQWIDGWLVGCAIPLGFSLS